ncbi:hypothetical protein ACIRVK_30160 [Streptomyces sp. NPDC101152]|uniref:hypothetical protein n=1 Tax=Streptomyces sp. NPDC101152 TaxID=3366116 RepID=UPI0037FFA979
MRGWTGGARELAVLAGALAVAVSLTVVEAEPAAAVQAPDVAMIVAGGTGRTTVLRSGQPSFARLSALLQPTYQRSERVPEAWAEGRYPPVVFTVVWGLSGVGGWPQTDRAPGADVAVERQDQLLVGPDGTPWIRSDPAPAVLDDDIRWHRAPRSVFTQLEQAKVLSGRGDGMAGADQGRGGRDGVWWAVPGMALGCAIGAGGTLLIRRAAGRHGAGPPREGPRQELIDL